MSDNLCKSMKDFLKFHITITITALIKLVKKLVKHTHTRIYIHFIWKFKVI